MKLRTLFASLTLAAVVFAAVSLTWIVFDALSTLSSSETVLIAASDGAVVKIENVRRGAIQFLSGTGGVTTVSKAVIPIAGTLLLLVSGFAMFGAATLFSGSKGHCEFNNGKGH